MLPAQSLIPSLLSTLQEHNSLVITAPPGAGKSTLLPLAMLDALSGNERILMLEPRRIAARQVAERMAEMRGEAVGQTVGYRVRHEQKVSAATRLEVITEGILTRMLVDDPTLDGVSIVIFDEFHERSIHSDVALALTRESQQIIRPDLHIVIMSATLDAESICSALQAPLLSCEGRMFPITDVRPLQADAGSSPEALQPATVASQMAHYIREAHRNHEGDILCFLPGEGEIRRCLELLGESLAPTQVLPLYGQLPAAQQRQAIAPSRPGERKVVLSTPIAETSLTISGVRVVIDSGLCRRPVFDAATGLTHLQTCRISLDMADQRRGRAGRVAPGVCYRLWSLATERQMQACRTPELLEADLAPMLLDVAAWGETDPLRLPWLTPPPAAHIAQARTLLQLLGALSEDGQLTPHGRRLAALPYHPRLANMLLAAGAQPERKRLATVLADYLDGALPPADRRRAEQQLLTSPTALIPTVAPLLAAAYPERIAQALNNGRFRLATGDEVQIETTDDLSAYPWLVAASVNITPGGTGRIHLAAPVSDISDLSEFMTSRDRLTWDNKQGRLLAQREQRIGRLLVSSRPLTDISLPERQRVISEAAMQYGASMLDFADDAVAGLQRRVAAVATWHPELSLPDLSTEAVLATAPEWLPFYIGRATTTTDLRRIPLHEALWGLLSYEQQQAIERIAPTHIAVPTGSRIRVEYRQGAELPILRVRLQECFGLTDTPRVDDGRRPVLMELLSPGFKPVQLTSDLRSFWSGTYFQVRAELRRRYPRHAWPDDPLTADAVRGVARKTVKND